jgi:Putative metallopeptidase
VTEPSTPRAPTIQTGSLQSEARIGKIVTQYVPSDAYSDIRTRYEKSEYLSGMTEMIGASIILPKDLPMSFDTCGEDNAFYDGETKSITLCYEIVKMLEDKFGSDTK